MGKVDTTPKAIAALMDGVTPGPWALNGMTGLEPKLYGRSYKITVQELTAIFVAGWEDNPDDAKEAAANARFIAASRELVPALAAEQDALRAEIERLQAEASKLAEALQDALTAWDDHNKTGDMMQGWWADDARATLAAWEAAQK